MLINHHKLLGNYFSTHTRTFHSPTIGIWLHESGVLGASSDGSIVRPPSCSVNVHYQTPEARDIIPDIVEVKCPFSALSSTVIEAAQNLKNFFLGKHTFTSSLMTYSLCTITCMLQYYFITQLWCNLLSRSISLTMYTFVRHKLQAVCENID